MDSLVDQLSTLQLLAQSQNIDELIRSVPNEYQVDILRRVQRRNEADQMYLCDYTNASDTDRVKKGLQGTFEVLGAIRKGTRESYKVQMYTAKTAINKKHGSFWCSCADMKFNASKKGTVCKHVCLIVCKVAGILDPNFFKTKRLSDDQFQRFVDAIRSVDGNVASLHQQTRPEISSAFDANVDRLDDEEMCPICYDNLDVNNKTKRIVACPDCHNNVHEICMRIWCERKGTRPTCIMCRSDVWKDWAGVEKSNKSNIIY